MLASTFISATEAIVLTLIDGRAGSIDVAATDTDVGVQTKLLVALHGADASDKPHADSGGATIRLFSHLQSNLYMGPVRPLTNLDLLLGMEEKGLLKVGLRNGASLAMGALTFNTFPHVAPSQSSSLFVQRGQPSRMLHTPNLLRNWYVASDVDVRFRGTTCTIYYADAPANEDVITAILTRFFGNLLRFLHNTVTQLLASTPLAGGEGGGSSSMMAYTSGGGGRSSSSSSSSSSGAPKNLHVRAYFLPYGLRWLGALFPNSFGARKLRALAAVGDLVRETCLFEARNINAYSRYLRDKTAREVAVRREQTADSLAHYMYLPQKDKIFHYIQSLKSMLDNETQVPIVEELAGPGGGPSGLEASSSSDSDSSSASTYSYIARTFCSTCVILLHGPPGTGKSSFIAMIADHFRLNRVNLGSVQTCDEFRSLVTQEGLYYVEDCDTNGIYGPLLNPKAFAHRNNNNGGGEAGATTRAIFEVAEMMQQQRGDEGMGRGRGGKDSSSSSSSTRNPLDVSFLLNVFDGAELMSLQRALRIFVLTANDISGFPEALMREQRLNFIVELGFVNAAGLSEIVGNYVDLPAARLREELFPDLYARIERAARGASVFRPSAVVQSVTQRLLGSDVFERLSLCAAEGQAEGLEREKCVLASEVLAHWAAQAEEDAAEREADVAVAAAAE